MTKAHKASNQEQFLLRRKLAVEGIEEGEWFDFIHELNHHPCVDFAERKANNQLQVTFDGTHWSTDQLLEAIEAHGGRLRGGGGGLNGNWRGTGLQMTTFVPMPSMIRFAVQRSRP